MVFSPEIDQQLDRFLQQHCPEPDVIRAALSRDPLCGVAELVADEIICRHGGRVQECWLILSGQVEVRSDEQNVTFRHAGEMVGEQGLLHFLSKKNAARTAEIKARGPVKLLRIDAAFQESLDGPERIAWILTLASVVNEKLEQATQGRSKLRSSATDQELLLRRFTDGDALGLVKIAASGQTSAIQRRRAIVYFADIANFSVWSAEKDPIEVAKHLRALATIQIDSIRKAGGQVDKLMGDGAMGYWFIDTPEREQLEPPAVVKCAMSIVEQTSRYFQDHHLDLGIRIGLHAGDVSFGDFGADNRIAVTVLGATVNTAARYEQAKSPELGHIRLSPVLRELIVRAGVDPSTFRGPSKVEVKHGVEFDVFCI
ncbi:cyclic nucleotide-binding domain-containing protein [Bradyrhizobium sp. CSA207]|nr:cyclic nucleotide-binding domain-containing protein [Bradyrhizobium sp. CSA207]